MKKRTIACLIGLFVTAGLMVCFIAEAPAADFPNKNIRIVVGAKPGGGMDTYARALGRQMEKYLPKGVNVVVENRPGAGEQETKYDMTKVIWMCLIVRDPRAIAISAKSKYKSLEDLQKADDPKFAIVGYTGEAGILLANATLGVKATYITGHRSSKEACLAAIRGDADAVGFSYWSIRRFIKSGQLKPVAVLGFEERVSEIPDVPTLSELGHPKVNSILGSFRTICGPPGIPPERVKYLRDIMWKSLNAQEFLAWSKKANRPVKPMMGEDAEKLMKKIMAEYSNYKDILGQYIK